MRQGFSIIDIAIWLATLGVVFGGYLAIQSMLRASDVRALGEQRAQYQAAVTSFHTKYNAMPGDLRNATTYWGAASVCPGTPGTAPQGTATCDGNGDGQIAGPESFRFWQQLNAAGLLPGTYSGVAADANNGVTPGVTSPAIKLSKSAVRVGSLGIIGSNDPKLFEGFYGNSLGFSTNDLTSPATRAFLTPKELWSIDNKYDDSIPGRGNIRAYKGACSDNIDDPAIAVYHTQGSGTDCAFVAILGAS